MGTRLFSLLALISLVAPSPLSAQAKKKPAPPEVSQADHDKLVERAKALRGLVKSAAPRADSPLAKRLPDIEIFAKALEWATRYREYPAANSVKILNEVADLGEKRIQAFQGGATETFAATTGRYALGYRSKVDDSVQPYAISLPKDFDAKASRRWPLYVVLHGRADTMDEAVFIRNHDGKPVPEDQTWIQLDVYGRGNNAYRWAGETDVFEAIQDVVKRYRIDERRVTLWGFSMGGAGAWHLGLHHPDRWASVGAGAGFTDFYRYQKVENPFESPQHDMLRIYDAVGYATNLADVPFITYGGEVDPQLLASQIMKEEAAKNEAPLEMIIGPMMGHKFDPASQKSFMEFLGRHNKTGRPLPTERTTLRFETWTLKYNRCDWITIEEQTAPYERSYVESKPTDDGLAIDTLNVSALSIDRGIANSVTVDDSKPIDLNTAGDNRLPNVILVKEGNEWEVQNYDDSLGFQTNPEQRKRHDLQGPIDDAFMSRFICVRGTKTPWSADHQAWSDWSRARFEREFDQWMRAAPRTVDDVSLSDDEIEESHLILFGDPGSNAVLARIVEKLPIQWTKDGRLTVAGQTYDHNKHGVALIFPNPLNPKKYVVLNSGHTFHDREFRASNAQLYPRLGDIAVIEFGKAAKGPGYDENPVFSDYFDAAWSLD